jgi:hypothetical protein
LASSHNLEKKLQSGEAEDSRARCGVSRKKIREEDPDSQSPDPCLAAWRCIPEDDEEPVGLELASKLHNNASNILLNLGQQNFTASASNPSRPGAFSPANWGNLQRKFTALTIHIG